MRMEIRFICLIIVGFFALCSYLYSWCNVITTRAAQRGEGGIVFSKPSVRLCLTVFVCLSVNMITYEPLEIRVSSLNFRGIIPGSKGRPDSKTVI